MSSPSYSQLRKTVCDCKIKPKFWDDDMKMDAWFAPFRNRELNPLNYDNKMMFWKNNVEYYCSEMKQCYFTLIELNLFFTRNGKTPSCLTSVLQEMMREGLVQNLVDFEQSEVNSTWVGWAVDKLVSNPFKWSFKKIVDVVSPSSEEITESTEFLHLPTLREQSENLYKLVNGSQDIFTYDTIKKLYSEKCNMNIDLKIIKLLVHWLELHGKARIHFENKHCYEHLIKFKPTGHTAFEINETEISVYILQRKEKSLIEEIKEFELEKESLQAEVKNYLLKKMRTMAKNTLRKQKELEKRIIKLTNVLENIQNLLYKVQDTEADSQILESYKFGANALKSRINKAGLNLDNIDHTMDEIEKALDLHNDIQETLGQSVTSQNEADLENELADLLLNNAPVVPPEPPSPGCKARESKNIDLNEFPEIPSSVIHSIPQVELRKVTT